MKKLLKRYLFFFILLIMTAIITIFNRNLGVNSFKIAYDSFIQMICVVPPIMLVLGLVDVWIPRETMIKYMGDKSGLRGIAIAMLIGSVAAGPMYAAFPFTRVLIKKGVRLSNIIIFMNAWCVTKISTLMFEVSYLGYEFTLVRLLINIPGVIIMGYLVEFFMKKDDIDKLYNNISDYL